MGEKGHFPRHMGFSTAAQVINYLCSHDEVRPEHEIKVYTGKHIVRPQGMTLQDVALAQALLDLVAVFAAPGVPMLYAGQEFGDDSPRMIDFAPLQWNKLAKPKFRMHMETARRLIQARRRHAALRSDHIDFLNDRFAVDQLVRFCRWDGEGDSAVGALNFGAEPRVVELPAPTDGRWHDVVGNRLCRAEGGRLVWQLGAYGAALFVPGGEG